MSHHTEAFFDDDGNWGWQCFEPGCAAQGDDFEDLDSAESDADLHELETA